MEKSIVGWWKSIKAGVGMICVGSWALSNAYSAPGDKLWEFPADGAVNCAPAIGEDGTVCLGAGSGRVYAIDGQSGRPKWSTLLDGATTSAVIGDDGQVFVGTAANHLFALATATGQTNWSFATGTGISTPAVDSAGVVYVGAGTRLFALNGQTGSKLWEYDNIGYPINGAPVVSSDGSVYIAAAGYLHAIDSATGQLRWRHSDTNESLLYENGVPYQTVWTHFALHPEKCQLSPPAIDATGTLYCLLRDNEVPQPFPVSSQVAMVAIDAATGKTKWLVSVDLNVSLDFDTAPVLGAQGTVLGGYTWYNNNTVMATMGGKLGAVDIASGTNRWSYSDGVAEFNREVDKPYGTHSTPAVGAEGTIYYASSTASSLKAVNGATGQELWQFRLPRRADGNAQFTSPAIGANGTVFVGSDGGVLYAIEGTSNQGLAANAWPKSYGNARNTGSPKGNLAGNEVLQRLAVDMTVFTVAGNGLAGFADELGTNASFHTPSGCWVAADGTVYVADTDNHRIRKVAPDGTVTTVAGSGIVGHQDGPALTAQFSGPVGICGDGLGDFWITETNQYVRKLDASGQVTTVAGAGVAGLVNGAGVSAQFNNPRGIVTDGVGNLWVADGGNHVVRQIAPDGTVGTWAGTGVAGAANGDRAVAQLNGPSGLARSASGILYVSERGGNRLRRISADGQVDTFSGSGIAGCIDGSAAIARFNQPDGLALDSAGNLWVADSQNQVIRRVTAGGGVRTAAGSPVAAFADGSGNEARFSGPAGIGFDAQGSAYVADTSNMRIRKLSFGGNYTLKEIPEQTVDVLHTLNVASLLEDTNTLSQGHFELLNSAPDGVSIDAQSGVITWTPSLLQGRASYRIWVRFVGNNGIADAQSFPVTVNWPDTTPGGERWQFAAGGAIFGCPAIGENGVVYFGSAEGKVYALDGNTGTKLWDFAAGSAVSNAVVLSAQGLLYVETQDGDLWALDSANGQEKWRLSTGQPFLGSPVVGPDRTVYFNYGTNRLWAVSGATGNKKWECLLGENLVSSSVMDLDQTLYVMGADRNTTNGWPYMAVYAIDARHGAIKWKSPYLGFNLFSQLALSSDGNIWICSGDRYGVNTSEGMVASSCGPDLTYGLSPTDNHYNNHYLIRFWDVYNWLYWRSGQLAPVIGTNGRTYCGMLDHSLWAVDGTNTNSAWTFAADGYLAAAPAVGSDSTVYMGTMTSVQSGASPGTLYALNGNTGQRLWQFPLASTLTPVALGTNGLLYVGTQDGVLHAITANVPGGLANSPWPKFQGNSRNTGFPGVENLAPAFQVPAVLTISEASPWQFQCVAEAADGSTNQLSYALLQGPEGLVLNPTNGVITWTPAETQGSYSNVVEIVVTDDLGRSSTNRLTLFVNATNPAPQLTTPVREYTVWAGGHLTFTNTATDVDAPGNTLTFALGTDAPAGAKLDANTGLFTWIVPGTASTNRFTITVTDNGNPVRSTSGQFTVVTRTVPEVRIESISRDSQGRVQISWRIAPGLYYWVQSRARTDAGEWGGLDWPTSTHGDLATYLDGASWGAQKYYRIMVVVP